MINVDIRALIEKDGKEISRYALVSGVAKRALEISKEAESEVTHDGKVAPVKKSVTVAVEELQKGYYEIIIPESTESVAQSVNDNQELD